MFWGQPKTMWETHEGTQNATNTMKVSNALDKRMRNKRKHIRNQKHNVISNIKCHVTL